LFMDAIIDCLYEEPREGVIKDDSGKAPWLRNDESVRSGSIMFTFRIGEKKYRVTRTRARSGKGTLNISQFIENEWQDCSKERYTDTQQEILNILGMDSFTFKSCALIMQDQYGLFLQAKPEERVEVLGTLLGLGIYQSMERIASDNARVNGAKKRELEQAVTIHNVTIAEFGKPDEELEACRSELAEQELRLQEKVNERDERKLVLEKKVAILNESGCVDIENAHCKFLQDAIEAKEKLAMQDTLYADIEARRKAELAKTAAEIEEKKAAMEAIGFDLTALSALQSECATLLPYVSQVEAISQRESQLSLIRAKIEHLKSDISKEENRLAEVKLKGTQAETEQSIYAKAFEEHVHVMSAITVLDPWVEKEKMIPVAEERNMTALNRVLELTTELVGIDDEIRERQAEADKEILAMAGIEEVQAVVNGLETEVNEINSMVRESQMRIGALQQKAQQIAKLKQDIAVLQEKQVGYAKETADYDTLKVAFSQSGVPHQIIRSIIPQLTATANTILGQMTGGKMGVEFRLERLQKNGKEKVSLDIFIEEYGKSVLPYLSKSGGEKVKSSLSVILALAEIKSSSAGVQLGMLFIDEPPFLDGDGIQAYCDALETIQSRYSNIKIMAITHDPTMKARFPQNLDVVKTEHGSKVIY
jgi:DNA repair exonuclease SbcCD ATPase subunit